MDGRKWNIILKKALELYESCISDFSTDELIEFCLFSQVKELCEEFLKLLKKTNVKDSSLALQKKEEGNQKYKKKLLEESLTLYTESIFHAAENDECLPLAYSNRSMVLEHLDYPMECIMDIDMAVACKYPEQKVPNLMIRKARCLVKLGNVEKAREILAEALKNSRKKEFEKVIENELKKIEGMKNKEESRNEIKLPEPVGGENENFPYASKYLSVHYDEARGRHVIADKDFEPGDVLFVEKPYVFVAVDKFCSNCGKKTVAPFPCWKCTGVYYCSPKCRDDSLNSYHSFECGFSEILNNVGISLLSLRVILKASHSLDELKKNLASISEPVYENGSIIHMSKGYEAVYGLVNHSEQHKRVDMFQYAMTALLLAVYLKNHTNYFPEGSDSYDLKLLTSVILRHISQLICNSSSVSVPFETVKESRGSAIYTSISMMNHSCEPSVLINSVHGPFAIVRAEVPIKKGEEVFNCYGPVAKISKKFKRQEILSQQYFFTCKCRQCVQKFDIQDKFTAFKCNKCTGPSVPIEENSRDAVCLSCGENSSISLDMTAKFNKFYSLITEGEVVNDVSLSLKKYLQAWKIGREIFYKFHVDLTNAAHEVASCLFKLGECRKSISFLKCCIQSEEALYGSLSFEIAPTMKELADVISKYVFENPTDDAKDLARDALIYYERFKKIASLFPEALNYPDLDLASTVLQMKRFIV